jgi:outer membrane protein TolC
MMTPQQTAKSFFAATELLRVFEIPGAARSAGGGSRVLVAIVLTFCLCTAGVAPAFGQNAAQNPPSIPTAAPAPAGTQPTPIAPVSSLGLAKHDFSNGPRAFPDLFKIYQPITVENPVITNSPRLDQLIHDGKLELSLQDAVELALENSMDIVVERYAPWLADTSILKAKAGGAGAGTPGGLFGASTASLPFLSFDPNLTSAVVWDNRTTPVNNPLISGTGTASTVNHLTTHTTQFNNQFTQGFDTGTNLTVAWNNTRAHSTSSANFFNPDVQSTLSVGFTQQLLSGFGRSVNQRNILIARNNRRIADWAFTQQAITTVTNAILAYWELVYARANVKVDEQAVTVAEKLYSDNKKQLDAGTMSPLDVVQAESELATDRQNFIVARTVQLQDEQVLKNLISKDPLASNFVSAEIITSDQPTQPAAIENPSFEDSIKEAFAKRPELQQQIYNLQNANIDLKATRNALRPELTLGAQYASVGLAGNTPILGATTLSPNTLLPILDANGNPVLVNGVPIYEPKASTAITGSSQAGFTSAQSQIFHNRFPEYTGSLNLNLPLRNRSAQADSARAILAQREEQAAIQQLKNAAILDVRNTYIALTQDRAQVEAASKARELQQQTFDAEQKKYRLGASTVYNVILVQRDLITAQGTELRALANLQEAKANYERALGRSLEVNHVTIADAKTGQVEHETLIPGTLHGRVIGTDEIIKDSSLR